MDVRCYARRIGSPLDSLMYMGRIGQGAMVGNDDSGGPDSYFRVNIPQDGEYWISVADHLKQGGPTYPYRIEVTPVEAEIALTRHRSHCIRRSDRRTRCLAATGSRPM